MLWARISRNGFDAQILDIVKAMRVIEEATRILLGWNAVPAVVDISAQVALALHHIQVPASLMPFKPMG
ncbi:hypothetical protein PGQ11_000090 [Apiospora arundinis]